MRVRMPRRCQGRRMSLRSWSTKRIVSVADDAVDGVDADSDALSQQPS